MKTKCRDCMEVHDDLSCPKCGCEYVFDVENDVDFDDEDFDL